MSGHRRAPRRPVCWPGRWLMPCPAPRRSSHRKGGQGACCPPPRPVPPRPANPGLTPPWPAKGVRVLAGHLTPAPQRTIGAARFPHKEADRPACGHKPLAGPGSGPIAPQAPEPQGGAPTRWQRANGHPPRPKPCRRGRWQTRSACHRFSRPRQIPAEIPVP